MKLSVFDFDFCELGFIVLHPLLQHTIDFHLFYFEPGICPSNKTINLVRNWLQD